MQTLFPQYTHTHTQKAAKHNKLLPLSMSYASPVTTKDKMFKRVVFVVYHFECLFALFWVRDLFDTIVAFTAWIFFVYTRGWILKQQHDVHSNSGLTILQENHQ